MLDSKDRLNILLSILARKNRVNDDVDDNSYLSRAFMNRLVISLNRIGIISDTEYTEALEKIW